MIAGLGVFMFIVMLGLVSKQQAGPPEVVISFTLLILCFAVNDLHRYSRPDRRIKNGKAEKKPSNDKG